MIKLTRLRAAAHPDLVFLGLLVYPKAVETLNREELPRFNYWLSVTNETTALLPRTSLINPCPPTTNILPRPIYLLTLDKALYLFYWGAITAPNPAMLIFFD